MCVLLSSMDMCLSMCLCVCWQAAPAETEDMCAERDLAFRALGMLCYTSPPLCTLLLALLRSFLTSSPHGAVTNEDTCTRASMSPMTC